jgi:hypothetical protein
MDLSLVILWERAVKVLLEDRLGLDGLELGLEVFGAFGVGGRVGATTRIGHVDVTDISDLVSWMTPGTNCQYSSDSQCGNACLFICVTALQR